MYAASSLAKNATLTSNRFCHANEAGFARGIVCLAGVTHNAGHRADTDNAAILVSDHRPCGCAGCDKGSAEIYFDDLIEFLIAHAKEQVVARDARVVYEDAYTFVFGGQRFEDLHEFGSICNINTFCDNGEAGFLDDGFELCKLVGDYVEACDNTALFK
jgi:diadenosine tetraphosphatase ApaH/serine/threonine PP2A family protein phosphatase